MRLTLRTLLAYMDDILEPADHEDLGKKIEASDFASELIHRSRDTVRRLRLGAPAVLTNGSDDVLDSVDLRDANSVAEYLDNTLPPEQVADFERMCLEPGTEPDMHLAEVASCHHILTMVLGEPAEVDAELKSRMYQLPGKVASGQQLRIEPAHLAPTVAPAQPIAAPPLAQPASVVASELPDYLREAVASKRRSRRWAIATSLLAVGSAVVYWFVSVPPAELPASVAQSGAEAFDDGEIEIEGLGGDSSTDSFDAGSFDAGSLGDGATTGSRDAATAPLFVPESSAATEAPGFVSESGAEIEAAPAFVSQMPDASETPGAADRPAAETLAAEQPEVGAVPEAALPDGFDPASALEPTGEIALEPAPDESATVTASVAPTTNSPEIKGLLEEGALPEGTGLSGVEGKESAPTAEPLLIASAVDVPMVSDVPPRSEDLAAIVAAEIPEREAVGPQRLGNYLGNNDLLLIYNEASGKWIRMPPRSPIATGDVLLTLPKFSKAHVVLADVNAYLSGGTRLQIPLEKFNLSATSAELNLEIVYGRMLLNAGLKGSQVAIRVGDQLREFSLAGSASLAVEADRMFVPGSDYENEAAPIKATWYLTDGSVEWPTAAGGTQTIHTPATWKTIDGIDEIPELIEELPAWIDREPVTDVERIARGDLAQELVAGESVGIRLLELTDGKGVGRKKEVRILAAASSLFVGEFEPLVKALNDSDQKRAWETHINDLRQALSLSPDVAARVRQAFVNIRGEEAAQDLMEMVIGYNRQQIGESREAVQTGALATLLKWLDHDSLDYRVLAIHNLREITGGVSKGYRPEDSSKRRKIDLRKIWDQFESNELLPQP